MAEQQAAECNGLDLGDLGCLDTGDIGLGSIIGLAAILFGLWMKLLGSEYWRIRIGLLVYYASWSTAYAGLLQRTLVRLRWFFGRPWSLRALDMCFRFAMVYALVYSFITHFVASSEGTTAIWTLVGGVCVIGLVSFHLARSVRRRHQRERRLTGSFRRRTWLHLREHLAYGAIAVVGPSAGAIAVLAAGIGGTAVVGGVTAAGGVAVVLTIAVTITGTIAGAGAIAGVVTGAIAVAIAGKAAGAALAASALIYFLAIPGLNALFDWLSLAVSRWLVSRLRADATCRSFPRKAAALLGRPALGGALAIACLFVLAVALINLLLLTIGSQTSWENTLRFASEAPFSAKASTTTIMLLSPLVPTAIHLFFALFALAAIRPPKRDWFRGWMEDGVGSGAWGNRAIVSAYLTFWCIFPVFVLWSAAVFVLRGLDWLWIRVGWASKDDPYPFWASIFRAAEAFVIF